MKEKIAEYIHNELNYISCDNCKYKGDPVGGGCDLCHIKDTRWEISIAEAERLADRIMGINNGD